MKDLPDVMRVKDVQNFLDIGKTRAYELVREEDFPSIQIGSAWRIPKEQFEKWLEKEAAVGGENHG